MSERLAKKVLLLGWDSADLKIINPLIDAGEMPNLQKLVERGVMGNLSSLEPILSPILWTSIATGQNADQHGIHGFIEPRPDGGGVRPVTSTSVAATPIWEILEQQGLASAVVGWFATYPANNVPGIVVSDLFCNARGKTFDEWPLGERIVSPPKLQEVMAELRVHPSDITRAQVEAFIPDVTNIKLEEDERPGQLVNFLARCATNHAAATHIIEHENWDLLAVYFETIDRLSHCFMEYHPPRMERVSEEDFARYQNVVKESYRFHDMMLGRYLELAGEDTTVMLISDHGFYSDEQRPASSPNMKSGKPVAWHRPMGTFVASGPGIRQDELVHGSSILDVAPTILHLLGLPVARNMEGRVLQHILEDPQVVELVDGYSRHNGADRPLEGGEELWESQESIRQLVELGYIDPPSEDASKAIEDANVSKLSNLAQVYRSKHMFAKAIETLQELVTLKPKLSSARLWLAANYISVREFDQARALVSEVLADAPSAPWVNYLNGQISFAEGHHDKALESFARAREGGYQSSALHLNIGAVLLQQREYKKAEEAFQNALEINDENVQALDGLGMAWLRQGRQEEAMESFLRSIALTFAQPKTHFHLGLALVALGHTRQALEAFQNASLLKPDFLAPQRAIRAIKKRLGKGLRQSVEEHLARREGIRAEGTAATPGPGARSVIPKVAWDESEVITIVSGIPRSGTSLMMQMLEKTGMELLVDNARNADVHNPRGYFEYQPVKGTLADNSWLQEAPGKAVKVVHALLPGLSPDYRYRVIFMERDLHEVLASQQTMIGAQAANGNAPRGKPLDEVFETQLARLKSWMARQRNAEVMYIPFAKVLGKPEQVAAEVLAFLQLEANVKEMAAVVDKALYRQARGR